jgi:hypothetical protein
MLLKYIGKWYIAALKTIILPMVTDAICLFVFLALQPIVVVFSQPGSGL